MRILIIIITFLFINTFSFAQDFKSLESYEFETEESFQSEEENVLLCSNYIFDNPFDDSDIKRLISIQYIMKWMTGTPDYTFEIGGEVMELTKNNTDLLGLYISALTKIALENKDEKLNAEEMHNRAVDILANYCSDSKNNMKPSKKLKKIIKAKKKN